MKQQTLRNCWENSKGAINAWCSIPNTVTAEMMSMNDFDSITIDMQHGLVDYQAALNMLQVISGSGKTPMVRVPWNEPGIIMKALDAGALGIVCPMINTPDDAINFVGATRYAPLGYRSSGPTRAMMVHGPNYHDEANDNIISFAMIETVEALENVEKIAATEGLTGIYIGPSDLSISMGYKPGLDRQEPEMIEAIKKIENNYEFTSICCIYPTSCFVTAKDLIQSFNLFKKNKKSFIISATEYSHPPQRGFFFKDKLLRKFIKNNSKKNTQNYDQIYHDAGQFYWGSKTKWLKCKNFFEKKTKAYIFSNNNVQDIDTINDWKIAELKFKDLNEKK